MFMMLSSWLCNRVIARVHPVHAINAEQRQTAADLWTKPRDLSRRSACRQHLTTSTIDLPYALPLPVEHTAQTTCLHPALSCVRNPIFPGRVNERTQTQCTQAWLTSMHVVRGSDLWSTGCEFCLRPCTAKLVLWWVTVCLRAGKFILVGNQSPRGQLNLLSLRGR